VLLRIQLDSHLPAYRQIADSLRTLLVDGSLPPGSLLPPVRQLALDLSVHFNTVAQAYRILAEEGWLDLRRRRGALVLKRDAPKSPDPDFTASLRRRLREIAWEMRAQGISAKEIAHELRSIVKGIES